MSQFLRLALPASTPVKALTGWSAIDPQHTPHVVPVKTRAKGRKAVSKSTSGGLSMKKQVVNNKSSNTSFKTAVSLVASLLAGLPVGLDHWGDLNAPSKH